MIEQLLTAQFWHDQLAVIGNGPALVIPLLLIAWLLGWLFKKSVDDGELRGYRAQRDAAEQRLQLAHDRYEGLPQQVAKLQATVTDQDQIIADLRATPAITQAANKGFDRLLDSNNEIKTAVTEISTSTINLGKTLLIFDEGHSIFRWPDAKPDKPKD